MANKAMPRLEKNVTQSHATPLGGRMAHNATPGRFLECQNAAFRFAVLNECVGPKKKRFLVLSTSARVLRVSDPGTQLKYALHLNF